MKNAMRWMLVLALVHVAGAADKGAKAPKDAAAKKVAATQDLAPATTRGFTLVEPKDCDGHAIENGFREACQKLGAQIDGMMLSHGMGFVAITKKSADSVTALQAAAHKQDADYKALGKKKDLKICDTCKFWMETWEDGRFDNEIVNVKHGVVNVVTGKTPQDVQAIHEEVKKEMEKMQMEGHPEE